MPVTVASCIPVGVRTCTTSPGATRASRASARSITTSPMSVGARPATSRNGLSDGSAIQFRPTSLAVPVPTDDPSTTSLAKPAHCGTADATPSTAIARSAMSASSARRTEPPSSPGPPSDSPRITPCTTASVPARASAMSSAARPCIESDNTSVARRKATDSMIATPVSRNRPRLASTLRVALFIISIIVPDPSSRRAAHRPTGARRHRGRDRRPRRRPDRPRPQRWDRA